MDKESSAQLLIRVITKFLIVFAVIAALFFGTTGSFSFINGWIYLTTILVTLSVGLAVLYRRDRDLLGKRIQTRETDPRQKAFVLVSTVLLLALYGLPGLAFRFRWPLLPLWLAIPGEIILLAGYALNLAVMATNSFASRVVEIQENQRVIDTGPYAIVRHPMYAAVSFVYIGTCLVLGFWASFIPCALVILVLAFRAVNEEKTLLRGLPGYAAYVEKVRFRMLPPVW